MRNGSVAWPSALWRGPHSAHHSNFSGMKRFLLRRLFSAMRAPLQSEEISRLKFLGVETSCDDSSLAVITGAGEILSLVTISQYESHRKWGGIHPQEARRAHEQNVDIALEQALAQAKLRMEDIDVIATAVGPGNCFILDQFLF
jgi:hypothetical protein